MWHRWNGVPSVLALFAAGASLASAEDVNSDTVAIATPYATKWDLRGSADGGCGVGGCDPRLTVDGQDNTVAESRWSCEPSIVSENEECILYFILDQAVTMSYLMLYFHESDDDTAAAIPFTINTCLYSTISVCSSRWDLAGSFETAPSTALGSGQRANLLNPTGSLLQVVFTLTSGQWIGVNEVDIFVDVSSSDSYELVEATESAIFEAGDITTVTPTATKWNLDGSDTGGCGVGGCEPELTRDGDDNTVGDSRWSCETALAGEIDECSLYYLLDEAFIISYLTIYFHESDDATATAIPFTVYSCLYTTTSVCASRWDVMVTDETRPGTELGVGQRVNLPRPSGGTLYISFDLAAGQVIGVNEVDIFVTLYGEDIPVNVAAVTTPSPLSVSTPASTPEPVEATSSATPAPETSTTPAPVEVAARALETEAPVAAVTVTPLATGAPVLGPVTVEVPETPAPMLVGGAVQPTNSPVVSTAPSTVEVGKLSTVTSTASKYDERLGVDSGCGTTGCLPELTRDGEDNTEFESRWSCQEELEPSDTGCYITYEFEEDFVVEHVTMFFRQSDDFAREANPFNITTGVEVDQFSFQLEGANVPGTSLGTGEVFALPTPVTARFVRIEAILSESQWISLNEAQIYVQNTDGILTSSSISSTNDPVSAVDNTPAPTTTTTTPSTVAPSVAVTAAGSGGIGDSTITPSTLVPSASGSDATSAMTEANTPMPTEASRGSFGNITLTSPPSPTVNGGITGNTSGAHRLAPWGGMTVGGVAASVITTLISVSSLFSTRFSVVG